MNKYIFSILVIFLLLTCIFSIFTCINYINLNNNYKMLVEENLKNQQEFKKIQEINKTLESNNDLIEQKIEEYKQENEKLLREIEQLKKEKQPAIKRETITTIQEQPQKTTEQNIEKIAYLTFDDGPSKNTISVLDTLKNNNIKATFFINGSYNKEIVQRIIEEGHTIGNHTNSHNYKTIYSSVDAFFDDFYTLENKLYSDFGIKTQIFRFPGGSNNTVSHNYGGKEIMKEIIKAANEKTLTYFDWNVSSGDANSTPATKNEIIENVLNGSKNKNSAIILMHDAGTKETTAQALPEIITGLKNLGFSFASLSPTSPQIKFQ